MNKTYFTRQLPGELKHAGTPQWNPQKVQQLIHKIECSNLPGFPISEKELKMLEKN